ncbi:U3 small nucleolar RNA-associated protein 25, partial [Neolecta irregularis DAH-3]
MDDSASTAREACQALVALLAAQDPGAGCSEHSAEAPEVRNVVSDDSGSESHSRGMDSESHSRGMDSESHSRGTDSESHSHDCMAVPDCSPADAEAARTAVQRISAGQWAVSNHQDTELGCVLSSFASDTPPATLPSLSSPSDFQKIKLKKRLLKTISKASTLKNSFSSIQKSLAPAIFSY